MLLGSAKTEAAMSFASKTAKVFAFLILIFGIDTSLTAQSGTSYRLPAGTRIRLRMEGEISSKFSSVNDTFLTRIALPVMVREIVAVPAGMIVEGRITKVSNAALGGRNGVIEVRMETLRLPNDATREIEGLPTARFRTRRPQRFWSVLGGSGIGAAIGAAAGSTRGALIGAGLGAGAGTGVALLARGEEVRLKEDDVFEIELKKEVILPVSDY
jgi:hypothetical protein